MIVTIHQPNFLPYPGFFNKIVQSDVLVLQDDVKFCEGFSNRNKIISSNGWSWITVPIKKNHNLLPINEVQIFNDSKWSRIHMKQLSGAYNKTKFFHLYKSELEEILKKEFISLFKLNFELITKIISWLDINVEIILESELNIKGTSTTRLVNVCKELGAGTYLSGPGGKNYINQKLFDENDINLKYQEYEPLIYSQHLSEKFIPNLSIIDMLANIGPIESLEKLNSKTISFFS